MTSNQNSFNAEEVIGQQSKIENEKVQKNSV